MLFGFGDIGRHFSKICTETFKENVHNPKLRRPRFQNMKNCFFNTWYCISQIHDLIPINKLSFRQPAQQKRDSAFEQKTRIVSSREIWGNSQNRFFSYNQRNKPSRAQRVIFGTYSMSFRKVCAFFSVKSPNNIRRVCTKIIKTIAHNTKWRKPRFFQKNQKLFF